MIRMIMMLMMVTTRMMTMVTTRMMMVKINDDATFVRSNILSWRSPAIDCRDQQQQRSLGGRALILVSLSLWVSTSFYRTQVNLGSDLWVRMSVRPSVQHLFET